MLTRLLTFAGYLYVIRVPVLMWLAMILLWYGFLSGSGAEPLLRGIFDVAWKASILETAVRFTLVTLAALLTGTAIGVTSRLTVVNAEARFGLAPVHLSRGLEFTFRIFSFSAVVAVLGGALYLSRAPWQGFTWGIASGVLFWFLLTFKAQAYLWSRDWAILRFLASGNWIPGDRAGYESTVHPPSIQERHVFAIYQSLLSLLAYASAFVLGVFDLPVPTLSLILLLLMLFCWIFAGLAFYLDRFRLPLVSVFAVGAMASGFFLQSDHFYEATPRNRKPYGQVTASALLSAGAATGPVVLVATTGGGIQAAGWAARVLTGLSKRSDAFDSRLRLISSVSGGSVGAMYFLDSFRNKRADASNDVVGHADASSLDQVAWGLTYPDLVFGSFPFLKGIGFDSKANFHLVDGGSIFWDRGRALEDSWRARLSPEGSDAQLMDWRNDAARGDRPGVIFNSTLVETGKRLLLSTVEFDKAPASAQSERDRHTGRVEFLQQTPDADLRVRTAARLSATFPYVSPAARMLRGERGGIYKSGAHAVDGGYYDNYGMTSLLDWLDGGFRSLGTNSPQVLIVEIRSSPTNERSDEVKSSYGFWFQLTHPLITLKNVRDTGQLSHNALDEDLIKRLYAGKVCSVVFEFNNFDRQGCRRPEPLNWHLTPSDIDALNGAWGSDQIKARLNQVDSILTSGCPKEKN